MCPQPPLQRHAPAGCFGPPADGVNSPFFIRRKTLSFYPKQGNGVAKGGPVPSISRSVQPRKRDAMVESSRPNLALKINPRISADLRFTRGAEREGMNKST